MKKSKVNIGDKMWVVKQSNESNLYYIDTIVIRSVTETTVSPIKNLNYCPKDILSEFLYTIGDNCFFSKIDAIKKAANLNKEIYNNKDIVWVLSFKSTMNNGMTAYIEDSGEYLTQMLDGDILISLDDNLPPSKGTIGVDFFFDPLEAQIKAEQYNNYFRQNGYVVNSELESCLYC